MTGHLVVDTFFQNIEQIAQEVFFSSKRNAENRSLRTLPSKGKKTNGISSTPQFSQLMNPVRWVAAASGDEAELLHGGSHGGGGVAAAAGVAGGGGRRGGGEKRGGDAADVLGVDGDPRQDVLLRRRGGAPLRGVQGQPPPHRPAQRRRRRRGPFVPPRPQQLQRPHPRGVRRFLLR